MWGRARWRARPAQCEPLCRAPSPSRARSKRERGNWTLPLPDPQQLPELTRSENLQRGILRNHEQVLIARHENIRIPGHCGRQHPPVCTITNEDWARCFRFGYDRNAIEHCFSRADALVAETKL